MNKHLISEENHAAEMANHYIASHLGIDPESEKELQERIEIYTSLQNDFANQYLDAANKERMLKNNVLHFLNGWESPSEFVNSSEQSSHTLASLLLRKSTGNTACGFYLRWNNIGVVVNPGRSFLENFHQQGYFLKDIQHIIVTKNHPEAYEDIYKIYHLNYQLNKLNPDLHVINYYMSQPVYQVLSHALKPNFKQERHMLHSLELFLDSSDIEKEVLGEGIILNYFSASNRGQIDRLGIKFELNSSNVSRTVGYLSGTAWSPLFTHHLGSCDVLIAGFGRTNSNDFGKLNYNDDCLGYFGTFSLLEAIKPKLFLCAEFDAYDGDIRLEVIKKLRKESDKNDNNPLSTLLPTDNGFIVDLNHFGIMDSLKPQDVQVIRAHNTFGRLVYISSKSIC